jgi:Flp pilus assembly pilin Flp
MKKTLRHLRSFLMREEGAEVSELALVLGLVVAGVILLASSIGSAVQQLFMFVNGSIP